MNEKLNYPIQNPVSENESGIPIVTPEEERLEIAADISGFGAVALGSTVEAAIILDINPESKPVLPNPVTPKMLKKTIGIEATKEKESEEYKFRLGIVDKNPAAIELNIKINDIQEDLDSIETLDEIREFINTRLRPGLVTGNGNMILDGADLPPIIQNSKDSKDMEWDEWFKSGASREELMNFAQWYTSRLEILSEPGTKKEFIGQLKERYIGLIQKGVDYGWISRRHKKFAKKIINKADIAFFSPFGSIPHTVGGMTQLVKFDEGYRATKERKLVMLPTITGDEVVVHEFGHVLTGVDPDSSVNYIMEHKKNNKLASEKSYLTLFKILNEGFTEHMTAALLMGSPEILDPDLRESRGIAVEGESTGYKLFRESLGFLINGSLKSRSLKKEEFSSILDSMIDGDFYKFAEIINERWGGRDIIIDVLGRMDQYYKKNPLATISDQCIQLNKFLELESLGLHSRSAA